MVVKRAPLRPTGPGWRFVRRQFCGQGMGDAWIHESFVAVLSSVDMVEQNPPGSGLIVPHYHVSASHQEPGVLRCCTDQEMETVRAAFLLGGAEEDNHGKGICRHLWIVVGREREPECPCKQDEDRIVEGDRIRYENEAHP